MKPSDTKDEEWTLAQKKVKVLFLQAIDTDLIIDCTSPFQMMQKLEGLYRKKSEAKQALIEKQISRLQYDQEHHEEFFTKFEGLVRNSKNAGGTIDWKRKLSHLIIALPDSLDHLTETIDLIPEEN